MDMNMDMAVEVVYRRLVANSRHSSPTNKTQPVCTTPYVYMLLDGISNRIFQKEKVLYGTDKMSRRYGVRSTYSKLNPSHIHAEVHHSTTRLVRRL